MKTRVASHEAQLLGIVGGLLLSCVPAAEGLRKDAAAELQPKANPVEVDDAPRPSRALYDDMFIVPHKKAKHSSPDRPEASTKGADRMKEELGGEETNGWKELGQTWEQLLENLFFASRLTEFRELKEYKDNKEEALARRRIAGIGATLLQDEPATAIFLYTQEWYRIMNGALRFPSCPNQLTPEEEKCKEEQEWAKKVNTVAEGGLMQLPDWQGSTLYRGITNLMPILRENDNYKRKGFAFEERGFLSTTASEEVATKFSQDIRYVFKIECPPTGCRGAKDISKMSNYPREKEVLWAPSTPFRITGVEEGKGFKQTNITIVPLY
mmetsp:Transcript_55693/g.129693  ORF Transcript_55693/g.129693 Transcript_55693/m.129693 type:complete len:325 (-) Transcript_55693:98-1072(-)